MAEARAQLVETDSFDRAARERALKTPELQALLEKGSRVLPHFGALLDDLFAVFFKLVVRLRPDAPASTALNRRILDVVLAAQGASELRASCALDEARAAAASLRVAKVVLGEIKRGETFSEEELLDQAELDRAEARADELERSARALANEAGAQAARLRARADQEAAKARAQAEQLRRKVEQALDELPLTLERRLSDATERTAEELEEDEELARSFAEEIGASGPGSASERLALAEQLRGNDKLRRLAALAGAFRRDALALRRKRMRRAPSELHRIARAGEISRVLPSELLGLLGAEGARHVRKLDFLRRLAEGELMAYELEGADRGGRGPMVICVDGSGSMSGARELWAKAVAIALLEVAKRQNRRATALVFSGKDSPLIRFELLADRSPTRGGRRLVELPSVLEFATCFPGGGTDFERPLAAARGLLEEKRLEGGDIIVLTDGEAPISEAFAEALRESKARLGFRIFGVLIDDPSAATAKPPRSARSEIERAAGELRKVADRPTTVTRLTSGAVRELFERI